MSGLSFLLLETAERETVVTIEVARRIDYGRIKGETIGISGRSLSSSSPVVTTFARTPQITGTQKNRRTFIMTAQVDVAAAHEVDAGINFISLE